jgi:hypothetical protein
MELKLAGNEGCAKAIVLWVGLATCWIIPRRKAAIPATAPSGGGGCRGIAAEVVPQVSIRSAERLSSGANAGVGGMAP